MKGKGGITPGREREGERERDSPRLLRSDRKSEWSKSGESRRS